MKKLLLSASVLFFMFSCQNDEVVTADVQPAAADVSTSRICASHEVLARQLKENPALATKMAEIEKFTEKPSDQAYKNASDHQVIKSMRVPTNVNGFKTIINMQLPNCYSILMYV